MALAMSAACLLPGVAGAAEVCVEKMSAVETAILDGNFSGRKIGGEYRDQERMLDKHYHAVIKLGMGKYDDAIDKLIDISDKAYDLANATKSKLDDDTGISNAVNDAIACIAP